MSTSLPLKEGKVLSRCGQCGATVRSPHIGQRPTPMEHSEGCPVLGDSSYRECKWCGGPIPRTKSSQAQTDQERCKHDSWWFDTYGRFLDSSRYNGSKGGGRATTAKDRGVRLEYWKAHRAIQEFLQDEGYGEQVADVCARSILRPALSPKARAELDRRTA